MRLNRNYEAELNLKDLFFGILYRWRILLLVGLIAAAAFGFMEYRGFDKYHRKGELTPAEAKYESNMEDIRQLNADIDAYNGLIRNKSEYRKTSVLMNMDPTNIWTAEKVYLLNTEADPADPDAGARAEEKILTVLSGALVEDAGEDKRTEVFGTGERKDTVEALPFSVDGIDHGLAVADAEPPLQRFRAGSVNLQGQRTDPLELQDNFFHEGGLVDFGQSHIDVKHVRARLLLLDALAEDVIQVFLSQSLLEALLPRGINSLPDQYRAGADPDCP